MNDFCDHRQNLRLILFVMATVLTKVEGAERFEFRDGDRVVLLGGAFVERLQKEGYFETALTTAFPDKNLTFRNLGWSGDTVWGDSRGVFGAREEGFRRLVDDTLMAKPTVLVIAYGHNEAFAGTKGLSDFRDGLRNLLDALAPTKARVVLIAPPSASHTLPPLPSVEPYNQKLLQYRDVIQEIAAERKVFFFDWYGLRADAEMMNGFHWTAAGEWKLAPQMAKSFGAPPEQFQIDFDVTSGKLTTERCEVLELMSDNAKVSMTVLPQSLPPPLLPLKNVETELMKTRFVGRSFANLQVTGLEVGFYKVLINGSEEFGAEHGALANGIDLPNSPDNGRVIKLRKVIQEKDALFFNRYRPQNETYLFLFRKYEQGNNAVEIPQFDPLISEKEKEIAEWRKPRKITIEIVKKMD